jgi:hypothetical protein
LNYEQAQRARTAAQEDARRSAEQSEVAKAQLAASHQVMIEQQEDALLATIERARARRGLDTPVSPKRTGK